jgi:hypothetical protein
VQQRVIDRQVVGAEGRHPVDAEQEAPELDLRAVVAHRLDHPDVPGVHGSLPLRDHPVQRVCSRYAVQLEHGGVQHRAVLAAVRRVVEATRLPPRRRALEHPRRPQPDAVVDRRHHRLGLLEGDEPQAGCRVGRSAEPVVAARERQLGPEGGHPVAVAAVDRLLGRPEGRDRLAARDDVLELRAHHAAQHAAAPVRGQDADDGDAGARHRTARNGEPEREGTCAADDLPVVERDVHPVERQVAAEALDRLEVRRPAAEVVADGADPVGELLQRRRGADLQRLSRSGAGGAAASAPGRLHRAYAALSRSGAGGAAASAPGRLRRAYAAQAIFSNGA